MLFIAANDHIKAKLCNQKEKREVSDNELKEIQRTEPGGNMVASVVDVIAVYMQV